MQLSDSTTTEQQQHNLQTTPSSPQSAPSSASVDRKSRPSKNEFFSNKNQQHVTVHSGSEEQQQQSSLVIDCRTNTELGGATNSSTPPTLEPLNHSWYSEVQSEIMERIRGLQREHHKRSLAHLLNNNNSSNQTNHVAQSPTTNGGILASPVKNSHNLYDTVADAFDQDGPPPPATPPYHRPFDHESAGGPPLPGSPAATAASPANLDSARHEIDSWLVSMEKRFGDFVQEYNQAYLQRRKSSLTARNGGSAGSAPTLESLTSEASLKKQLTIISVSLCIVIW